MTSQLEADLLAKQIGEIRRKAGREMLDAAERTQFETALIADVRKFCQDYQDADDVKGEIWFVMSAVQVWEERGAKAAVEAMLQAWERSEAARE